MLTPEIIQKLIASKKYRFSQHAEAEREADRITMADFEEAFLSNRIEILEERPDDLRGFSCLALGFTGDNRPIHAVFGKAKEALVVVTVYRPDSNLWIDYRQRR